TVALVTANQLSPRVSLTYKPLAGTTLHAGYARYFTPPSQIEAGPANVAAFQNTATPFAVMTQSPVKPERSHYFDTGITQKLGPAVEIGVD
ncbi:TonB-dependent receptor, partial [Acinetobacter baumannii]